MVLTKEEIEELQGEYFRTSDPAHGEGFIAVLKILGVSEEQIELITRW